MSLLARAGQGARHCWGWLAGRLRNRPDSEHEMSFNRLFFAALIVVILLFGENGQSAHAALAWMALYFVLALGGLAHILLRPGICQARRLYALLLDCGFLSWQLHLGGEHVALFYPVYLWVIFGNGFRFGIRYLLIAVPVAALSFLLVVLTTPFWSALPHLSAGLLIGLVILPAYAGTLIRKLSQATQAAEEANKAKSLFLASISHELRTPLTAIIGMNQLLRTSSLTSAQREMVETVDVASHSLRTLINQLLDFSRIEAGQMTSSAEDFDLLNLLIDVRRIVESQLREKQLAFVIHVTPRTPTRLRTSRLHLQEILVNLVGNAVKFTESGGIVVAVDVLPQAGSDGGFILRGEISDTGIGIPIEARARIFESFTQGDPSILNRFGGTGLGLAITRRLVTMLGGDIAVESTVGQGSTFSFHIRASKAMAVAEPNEEPAEEPAWHPPAGKVGLRVRNPVKRSLLRANLVAMGVEVAPTPAMPGSAAAEDKPCTTIEYDADGGTLPPPEDGPRWRPNVILIHPAAGPGLPELAIRRRCMTLLSEDFSDQELQQALLIASRLNSAGTAARPPALPAASEPQPLRIAKLRRHVLLVDDNRVNQRVFTRILEAAGHKVSVADNGNKALDILEREADRFDIVLMDFNMPGMDGLEATKLYRVMALGGPRLPIVGLTADAFAQAQEDWRAADMDGCLVKPVAPQDLVAAVEKMSRPSLAGSAFAVAEEADEPASPPVPQEEDPALDQKIIDNLRLLGDNEFLEELMSDFLSDAKDLIDQLEADATRGDSQEFRSHAHALRSSAANVGAMALGKLCIPWSGLRGGELRAQAVTFTARANSELKRTRQAVVALNTLRRANNQ
ncbi:ATP-binding protein [Acidocella sp.]|uniref:ATP-binding protein n=1 Tax=Acidocella sp. TaxID=50710 RepID=UPI003D05BF76